MRTLNQELTEAEKAMFRGLGWEYLFHTTVDAPGLYKMAVEKVFISGIKDRFTSALRCSYARIYHSHYRGNVEHDNVILYELNNFIP